MQKHEAGLKAVAAGLTDEARPQLLEQRSAWRRQVRTQIAARGRAEAPALKKAPTKASGKKAAAQNVKNEKAPTKKAANKKGCSKNGSQKAGEDSVPFGEAGPFVMAG